VRPGSIARFELLYLIAIVVGIANSLLSLDGTLRALEANSTIAALGVGKGVLLGAIALNVAIDLLLWFLVARRASNVAKWVLVVLAGFSLTDLPALLSRIASHSITTIIVLAILLLKVLAISFLFHADARDWLGKGKDNPVDPETFG
jgi:hypothetical protein